MPRWQEPAPVVEDEFISEVVSAPAVVAVAARVTTPPSVRRRLTAIATAVALGAVAVVGSFAMGWPATPAPPSLPETAPVLHAPVPMPLEGGVAITGEASASPQTLSPGTPTQTSDKHAIPVVQATSGVSVGVASVRTSGEGQLRVTSAPSGARVTVNGIGWGQTPLTIEHLSAGMKTVRVTMPGYISQERRIDLHRDRPAGTLHVTLTGEAGR